MCHATRSSIAHLHRHSVALPSTMTTCRAAMASSRLLCALPSAARRLPPPPPASRQGSSIAARGWTHHPRRHVAAAAVEQDSSSPGGRPPAAASATSPPPPPASPCPPGPPPLHGVPIHFSELPLDRAGSLRKQEKQLQKMLGDSRTRVLLLSRGRLLVAPAGGAAAGAGGGAVACGSGEEQLELRAHSFAEEGVLAPDGGHPKWLPLVASPQQVQAEAGSQAAAAAEPAGPEGQAANSAAAAGPEFLFLGLDRSGAGVFAVQAPAHLLPLLPPTDSRNPTEAAAAAGSQEADAAAPRWVDVRNAGQQMAGQDAAVAALASGLVQWHASAAFCSRTGAPTVLSSGGHSRTPAVAPSRSGRRPGSVYPRVDPAVIVAVGCGDWLLLGRKASWAEGRYSCLAGFTEIGETLEQSVAREVAEESGVHVDLASVRYHSSQPWPFPASLMIGFLAETASSSPQNGSSSSSGADNGSAAGGGSSTSPAAGAKEQQQLRPGGLSLLAGPALMAALEVGLKPAEAERYLLPKLSEVQVDPKELEDARWFHLDWLEAFTGSPADEAAGNTAATRRRRLAGSTGAGELAFRIPGRYALANRLISSWVAERQALAAQRLAADLGERRATAAEALHFLAAVPDVSIDQGCFKYMLLRLSTADGLHSKLLVRGDCRAAYHNNVLQATAAEVRAAAPGSGLKLETVGGGRIEHYPEQRVVSVYGYSAAFGQAPHDVTGAILRRSLPFHTVSVSYDGY